MAHTKHSERQLTMYQIEKSYSFSASHNLTGLPDWHQCARLHGHNYIVTVILQAEETDLIGFVKDFGDLAPIKQWLDDNFDHYHLNDKLPFNPTSENFARYIYESWVGEFPQLAAVRVSETPTSWAEYRA